MGGRFLDRNEGMWNGFFRTEMKGWEESFYEKK
jgi:hypothetical protein